MKKILTALITAMVISATPLAMSGTANAQWGYHGFHRGWGGYGGRGYRGFGVGYRGLGWGWPRLSDIGFGNWAVSDFYDYRSCERPDRPISCLSASRMTADFFCSSSLVAYEQSP